MSIRSIFQQENSASDAIHLIEITTARRRVLEPRDWFFLRDGAMLSETPGGDDAPRAFHLHYSQGRWILRKASLAPDVHCLLFGREWEEEVQIQSNIEYQLQLNQWFYVFRLHPEPLEWLDTLEPTKWQLFDVKEDVCVGEYTYRSLLKYHAENPGLDLNPLAFSVSGMEGVIPLAQLTLASRGGEGSLPLDSRELEPGGKIDAVWNADAGIDREGPLVSPFCWERFDYGDILHIAQDERLIGDPVLGGAAMLRFSATRFDVKGHALDAYDQPCSSLADPHTRHALPYGFLHLPQIIFSIVGAPGSGKSNYLSSLIHRLQHSLYSDFEMVLKDADPAQNAPLNDMKNCLFGRGSREHAALLKTQLDGSMYFKIKKDGRVLSFPRPFVYSLFQSQGDEGICNVVFYDNAGEQYEPGNSTSAIVGAQHVAAADTLFFLVDPTTLSGFRQRLPNHPDPQLKSSSKMDSQDILLREMEIRMRKVLGAQSQEKIHKPLAMLLGKCDIWKSLLEPLQFRPPIENRMLSQGALLHNSNMVRSLLLEVAPQMVANAESISPQVMYFPVSAFGHSPTVMPSGALAPNPSEIAPFMVEVPALWALAHKLGNTFRIRPKAPVARAFPPVRKPGMP
jgi:hypothetical protein